MKAGKTVSTVPVVNESATSTRNVDYKRYVKGTPKDDGTTKWDVTVLGDPSEKVEKDLLAEGYTLQATQTIAMPVLHKMSGYASLITDEQEQVNVAMRGINQKLQQAINSALKDTDENGNPKFEITESAYDPSEWLNEPTSRRNLTQNEKAARDLAKSGFKPEQIKAMLAILAQQAQQAQNQVEEEPVSA